MSGESKYSDIPDMPQKPLSPAPVPKKEMLEALNKPQPGSVVNVSSPPISLKSQEPVANMSSSSTPIKTQMTPSSPSPKVVKSPNGCKVKVIIPEFDGTKMAIALPTQTTDEFIKTLLKYPYDSLVSEELRLLIPMVSEPHAVRGFIMRPDTFMGAYGIGLQSMPVEIPVLILVKKNAVGVYDLSTHESFLRSQSAGLKIELIPSAWCEALIDLESFKDEKKKKLHKLIVETGIPFCIKGHVWAELAEVTDLVRKCPGVYESISKRAEENPPSYARKIRVDLCRSMPNHVIFADQDGPGVKSLSRVLYAFGEYEREIGYCQGLNFIAALLLTIMNEEFTFWTLIQLMRKYQMKNFFTMDVPLLQASLSVFSTLLEQELPDVAKHFEKECVPVEAFAAPWFQTIFMGTEFPFEITMRVWDCFMINGIQFVYKAALMFLKIARDKILKTDITGLMGILHFDEDTMKGIEPNYFIDAANKIKLKSEVDPVKTMNDIKEKEDESSEQ